MTYHQPVAAFSSAREASPPAPVATSLRKRALDVAGAALGLLIFAPLLLLIAFVIWLGGDGPVLFRQQRSGLGGRPFAILKFRTMRASTCSDDVLQAVPGDPRVTSVGRILRRLSLDELPQLFNVLKGDMSLVGPRPHALPHDALWGASVAGYAGRFRARPGLTGRAQVLGYRGLVTTSACIRNRIAADNAYIDHWSFWVDLALILRTIPILFGDDAAV